MRRLVIALSAAVTTAIMQSNGVLACGGLVAPNGSIHLSRATTLVDWHDGVEKYLTSFAFHGDVSNFGWIVPLPAVPTRIEEGGAWTLQRLERQVHPPLERDAASDLHAAVPAPAAVLQQVRVDALDVTVLKGSGQAVIDWCVKNSFVLPEETRDHLLHYAQASPIFMAAKYDVSTARKRGLLGGDGTPLLITMRTPHAWVPLEILANDDGPVGADVFLLSDEPVRTGREPFFFSSPVGRQVGSGSGFVVRDQEQIDGQLHRDLSTDRNMGWVRPNSWLTYLTLDAPSDSVTYDLNVMPSGRLQLAGFGTSPNKVGSLKTLDEPRPNMTLALTAVLAGATILAVVTALVLVKRGRSRAPGGGHREIRDVL